MRRGIKHKGRESVASYMQKARMREGVKKGGRGMMTQPGDSSNAISDS